MNQQAKSAIKSLVLDLRHTLEDEIVTKSGQTTTGVVQLRKRE